MVELCLLIPDELVAIPRTALPSIVASRTRGYIFCKASFCLSKFLHCILVHNNIVMSLYAASGTGSVIFLKNYKVPHVRVRADDSPSPDSFITRRPYL